MSVMPRFVLAACLLALAAPAAGQDVIDVTQDLDFDAPEAWAMKFFTSASLLTSLGPVRGRGAGEVAVGFEAVHVPHLDREQRTVGFGGFKEEDLNRSPAWGRLRLDVGLGRGFNATLGWMPPIAVDGVEANLLALALEKELFAGERWNVGLRAHVQQGTTKGDLTCAAGGAERFESGSSQNPFGCEGASSDEVTMDATGLEVVLGYRLRGRREPVLHFGAGFHRLDMELQVDAPTFGLRDRTLLLADGDTTSWTAGASWNAGGRGRAGVELFYSALDVQRRESPLENDPLFHLRAIYRLRIRGGR